MKKYFEEWDGDKFPIREVRLPEELGGFEAKVADYELWNAIAESYERDDVEAVGIDNTIFYYFNSGFIANDPTDEEIIQHLERDLFFIL